MNRILCSILTIAGVSVLVSTTQPPLPEGHPTTQPPLPPGHPTTTPQLPAGHPTVEPPAETVSDATVLAATESIGAVIDSYYRSISGPQGQPREWEPFRNMFLPHAMLVSVRTTGSNRAAPSVMSVEQYISLNSAYFEKGGYHETEVHREMHRYGGLAQVFSTYESRRKGEDAPYARGINGFQLVFDGQRWWINSISWQAESPSNNPIPAEFLPATGP